MDPDLSRQCRLAEAETFAALFDAHHPFVYKLARLTLGDPHEAEDAVQEVFLKVYRALPTFDPQKGSFTAWLYRITVNHCRNIRRKQRLAAVLLGKLPAAVFDRLVAPAPEPAEEDDLVWHAVNHLSGKLRAVVLLRFYLDLSYEEIAQCLGVPVGTVKSRLSLALHTLQRTLRPLMDEARAEPAAVDGRVTQ